MPNRRQPDNRNDFFRPKQRPLILGHRGVPLLHQENTLAGLRRAVELGLDGVEFDVFLTKDDRVVVCHDDDLERLTGHPGFITKMTWDEVSRLRIQRKIDMGGGTYLEYPSEERIPLLEEVLEEFKGKLLMNIEMKAYAPKWSLRNTGTEVARVIRQTGAEASVVVTSFDFFMLYYLERAYPGLHSGFAYDDSMLAGSIRDWARRVPEVAPEVEKALGERRDVEFVQFVLDANGVGKLVGSTLVDGAYPLLNAEIVAQFHHKGMLVGGYTVFPLDTRYLRQHEADQEAVVGRLQEMQVDWIETDDPERLQRLL
jgi:glycerophosphoryl diester phosphodiesterase